MLQLCTNPHFVTGTQLLHHFSLLPVLKVRVVAGDSQVRMTDLIFHEVTGHHARLRVADSTMSEGVHSTGLDADFFAERC